MTKVLSEVMEARRLWIDRVERRKEERVLERVGVLDGWGNMRSASVSGCDMIESS